MMMQWGRSCLVAALLLCAGPAWASIDIDEGFEYATQASMLSVWSSNCSAAVTGVMDVSTARFHSGAKSLRLTFPFPDSEGGCYMDRALNAQTDNFYMRVWVFLENFSNNTGVPTKMWLSGESCCYPNFWGVIQSGGTQWGVGVTNTVPQFVGTIAGGAIPQNTWACLEYRVSMNTPGVANGIITAWINEVQVANSQTLLLRRATDDGLGNGPGSNIAFVQTYRQHGVGVIYYDDYAASRDTRIGCGGTLPPTDTTPPGTPTNFTATPSAGGQITLAWTPASPTDSGGSGFAAYNILRCTPSVCAPVANVGQAGPTATSYVDTTVAAGTGYSYKINGVDNAGNTGQYTAVASATTTATFKTVLLTETFDRANNTDLGATWDAGYTARDPLNLVSNQLRVTNLNTDALETYNGVSTPNDQHAQMTMSQVGGSGTRAPGVVLRMSNAPNVNGYECRILLPSTSRTGEWNAGVFTQQTTSAAWTWAAGDKIRCEMEATTFRMYAIRGTAETLVGTFTDATHTSGKTGIIHYVATGTTADVQIDDFIMGGFNATPPVEPTIVSVTPSATGATLTYGATTPTTIRVTYGNNAGTFNNTKVELISAFPGGVYTFTWPNGIDFACFYPRNSLGVENTAAGAYTCVSLTGIVAAADTAPLVLSNPVPTTDLPAGTTSTTVSVDVNKNGQCRMDTTDRAYNLMDTGTTAVQMTPASLTMSATLSGLTNGSTTVRYVRCLFTNSLDVGYPNLSSLTMTVQVLSSAGADVTAPTVPAALVCTGIQSQGQCVWTASTDAVGVVGYQLYISVDDITYILASGPTLVVATTIIVNLTQSTAYYAKVLAKDAANNASALSSSATFTTGTIPDFTPPSTMTNLRLVTAYTTSVIVTSDPGTDDHGSVTTTIELSPAGCGAFVFVFSQLSLEATIRNLVPNTTYCARGKFSDGTNMSVAYSDTITFTTAAIGLREPRVVLPFGVTRDAATRAAITAPRDPRP